MKLIIIALQIRKRNI